MSTSRDRTCLRDLPLATRLVLAAFFVSIGCGHVAALARLHFGLAAPGEFLPGSRELEQAYFGVRERPVSDVERLLEATTGPLNGAGSMRPAFTDQSDQWGALARGRTPQELSKLTEEREGERLALLSWVRAGASKESYDNNDHPLGEEFDHQPVTREFLVCDPQTNRPALPKRVMIRALIAERCVTCHGEAGRNQHARLVPLDSYDRLGPRCKVKTVEPMTVPQLAQTTHAHLLGLALLYGVTGCIFSYTSYPGWMRAVGAPLPLTAQLLNIASWWLCRFDPLFAQAILATGIVVALGLAVQVLGSLLDLFGKPGRIVLTIVLAGGILPGYIVEATVIDPYLHSERMQAEANR